MKNKILPSVTLSAICLLVAVLLASVNLLTAPIIKGNNDEKAAKSLAEVLPGGTGFTDVTITDGIPDSIDMIKKSSDGGYVFRAVVTGKSSGMTVMIGIDSEGKIAGTKCTVNTETPRYAEPVFGLTEGENGCYVNMTEETYEEVIVAKSTLTSRAYATAVKDALEAFNLINFGSAEKNCNRALGTSGVTFEKWFMTESITADAVYYADGHGVVAVIDNTYIGVKNGTVVTEGMSEDLAAVALEAYNAYTGETLTKIELSSAYEEIEAVYKTTGGNYLFMLNARGWGKDGDSDFASGEYIKIKLVIDKDGKILSIVTLSQNEGEGYGDACEKPDYYEKFIGKNEAGLDDVTSLSGATVTSQGYKNAIKTAFTVFENLTGGNG